MTSQVAQDEKTQYVIASAITLTVAIPLTIYTYFKLGSFDLYAINKAIADTAAVVLGMVLMIGPGSRLFKAFGKWLHYRKELGIIAFFLVVAHQLISLFLVPDKFPLARFFGTLNIPFYFGLAATLILALLYLISNDSIMEKIGRKIWWELQYWGVRVTFLFLYLHVTLMKWKELVLYYTQISKENAEHILPSTALITFWFMSYVIVLRLAEFANRKLRPWIWYAASIALASIYIITVFLAFR